LKEHLIRLKGKTLRHKVLVQNFSYLSALQIINILLPLITYPYLIRVLGKETYGLVIFAQAIIGYLLILVSFGFNISATKEISVHRNNKERISEIVSSVLTIKVILFLLALGILYIILLFIPQGRNYHALFYLTMWMCFYEAIFPGWYFQGIEKMKYITFITLISRLSFLGLIFIFIHSPGDYLFVPIINGIGSLLAGITSLYILLGNHKIKFRLQPMSQLVYYFTGSVPIFISNISSKIYVSTNKVLVGAFLGMEEVAYYDLAEKITSVFKIPQSILSQTLFPKISKEKDRSFVKKIFKLSVVINLSLFAFIILFSKHIILLLGGVTMLNAITTVNILSITIPIISISNVLGIQLIIPFGYPKTFSKVILTSGIFYILQALFLWLSIGFTLTNIACITVTTELFVTIYMFYYCKKYNLWI